MICGYLQEVLGVDRDDSGLVWLRDIRKDGVDGRDEHPVLLRVSRVHDDGDDVRALLRQREKFSSRTERELDGVNSAGGADDVGHMRNGGAGRSAKVQHLVAGLDVDVVHAAEDGRRDFRSERVPHTVLLLHRLVADLLLDSDALLAVDGLAGDHVERAEVVLFALRDEDSLVAVFDDGDLGCLSGSLAASPASRAAATTATACVFAGKKRRARVISQRDEYRRSRLSHHLLRRLLRRHDRHDRLVRRSHLFVLKNGWVNKYSNGRCEERLTAHQLSPKVMVDENQGQREMM